VIRIYNVLGQLVRALSAPVRGAGLYTVDWDGRSDRGDEVPSGVYVYVLSLEQGVFAGKMTLVR
jgi:flagellar hook assembly protein FlgD